MEREIESVAVVGAGAMGGMYASFLEAAGVPVTLVARGERADRLRSPGLTVNGTRLNVAVHDAASSFAAGPVDLVIVAVKHHQLDSALDDVAALVGPDTIFLSVLNGLDSEERIAARFAGVLTDPAQVLLCIALAMDAMRVDNTITFRQAGRLVLGEAEQQHSGEAEQQHSGEAEQQHSGEAEQQQHSGEVGDDSPSSRVRSVQRLLDRAGLEWSTPADMRHEMWWKFMVNVGVNQASAIHLAPYGAFVDDGEPRRLMLSLFQEVVAVAAAEGVRLGPVDLERWDRVLAAQPVDGKTSMHQDVEAGRVTEVDIFAGHVVTLGRRHDIPTPVNASVLEQLST